MKNFKTKKIVLGTVMALSAVSLASVGFANWIINGITGIDSDNINVTIGQVADTSVTTTMNEGCELAVAFDNYVNLPSEATSIFDNNDGKKQDLDFTLNFKISTTGKVDIATLVDQVTFKFTQSEGFAKSVKDDYVVSPFGTANGTSGKWESSLILDLVTKNGADNNPKLTVTKSRDTYSVDVVAEFSFKWGSKFNGHNPGYLEKKDSMDEATMKTNLKAFKDLIGADFAASVEITPSKKAA